MQIEQRQKLNKFITDILLVKDMGDSTFTTVIGDDIKFSSSTQNLSNEKALYGPDTGSLSHSLDVFIKEHQQERKLIRGDY